MSGHATARRGSAPFQLVGPDRPTEMEALELGTAELAHDICLAFGLDTFSGSFNP